MLSITLIIVRTRVKINNDYTEEFKVESAVKYQILYLQLSAGADAMLKQLDLRGNISTH
jgi:uncharacterized protein YcgL (UPF0745 family)